MSSLEFDNNLRQRRTGKAGKKGLDDESHHVTEGADTRSLERSGYPWSYAFFVLLLVRMISVKYNIIHDCDETFNYWEPLHYLLYGTGLQTWEYSAEFGLRSYLYLLLHKLVAGPAAFIFGDGSGKVYVFYAVRAALGALSAACDAALVTAVARHKGQRVGVYTLALLALSSGCFFASTTFLPSTFSMCAITLAVAACLHRRPVAAVAVAAAGVLLGWPFAVLATAPIVLHSLFATGRFWAVLAAGTCASVATLIPSITADAHFYGRWTCSVLNLVAYNIAGGGDSALYGVEGPLFYLRNGANNFNLALPFALALPAVALALRRRGDLQLLLAASPLYLWLAFMSLQPHKEERFLYVVYPLICLAAAASIDALPELLPRGLLQKVKGLERVSRWTRPLVLGLTLVLSLSRIAAILTAYSAPLRAYSHIPAPASEKPLANETTTVCVGSEWHRFPSSFFLPSPHHRVAFLDDGFGGLLPFPFDAAAGGTRAAPSHFNNQNKASPLQFVNDEGECDYLVELDLERPDVTLRSARAPDSWKVVYKERFLDNERSPALYRALYIPGLSTKANKYGTYIIHKRTR
eukprot:jgi/Mesen1/11072/ME000099S10512